MKHALLLLCAALMLAACSPSAPAPTTADVPTYPLPQAVPAPAPATAPAPTLTVLDDSQVRVVLEHGTLLLTTPEGRDRPVVRLGGCTAATDGSTLCGVTFHAAGLLLPEVGLRVTAVRGLYVEVSGPRGWETVARYD